MKPVWDNQNTRLFLIDDSGPRFLQCVGIWRIWWPNHGNDTGRIVIFGYLPHCLFLKDFPSEAQLDVLDTSCHDPCKYDENAVIMRFRDCQVRKKWIRKPVVPGLESAEALEIYLDLDCMIEIKETEMLRKAAGK